MKMETINPVKRVQVYWNLHKNMFSVRDKKTNKVIAHTDSIILNNVKFVVHESGRQRVLKEQRKNVHAYVEGDVCIRPYSSVDYAIYRKMENPVQVKYNPYKKSTFYLNDPNYNNNKHTKPITEANSTVVMKTGSDKKGKVYIDYNKEYS